eukprot:TRINITY_DN7212_c0_g1_i1.p1 TRINITY_DN7212_c0_g1~~TRINITY_DN7212_c0_g1_i1.p1  ORF type:complete len:232 (+),score=96.29 TRINITY_DN7212_c0_g1_i1:95-697(+)
MFARTAASCMRRTPLRAAAAAPRSATPRQLEKNIAVLQRQLDKPAAGTQAQLDRGELRQQLAEATKQLKAAQKAGELRAQQRAEKERKRAAGPTNSRAVFLAQELKGQHVTKDGGPMKAASAKWDAMTPEQKKPFQEQAAANRAKLQEARGPKKAPSKYNIFVREHYPAAHAAALGSGKTGSAAAKAAFAAVVAQWKAQK